jgi:alcohol/geraniol dehydrogenase (NADP+)
MSKISAWVATAAKSKFVNQEIDLGPLKDEEVEVEVQHCGICHSDLSVLNNDWGISQFPAVLGHEITGRVVAVGPAAKGIKMGQKVGIGWASGSCMHCNQCISGNQNCCPESIFTIVGHKGGFATRVRSHWAWAIPIPDNLPIEDAGPLLCGGITVFNPLISYSQPTNRVGIVGIGGLGHMAVKFAAAFGNEVTAFTSSEKKFDEALGFGAHKVVSSRDSAALEKLAGTFDLVLITANAPLDWDAYIKLLAPKGRLHFVGVVTEPIPVHVFPLISIQGCISGSPSGPPAMIKKMLEFAALHQILPKTEHFPMSRINEAFEHLAAGKARYRIVLDRD